MKYEPNFRVMHLSYHVFIISFTLLPCSFDSNVPTALLPSLYPPPQIPLTLLHGIQPPIRHHALIVLPPPTHQRLYPFLFPPTLHSRPSLLGPCHHGRSFQLLDYPPNRSTPTRHNISSPFAILPFVIIRLKLVKRIIQRIFIFLPRTGRRRIMHNPENLSRLGIPNHARCGWNKRF